MFTGDPAQSPWVMGGQRLALGGRNGQERTRTDKNGQEQARSRTIFHVLSRSCTGSPGVRMRAQVDDRTRTPRYACHGNSIAESGRAVQTTATSRPAAVDSSAIDAAAGDAAAAAEAASAAADAAGRAAEAAEAASAMAAEAAESDDAEQAAAAAQAAADAAADAAEAARAAGDAGAAALANPGDGGLGGVQVHVGHEHFGALLRQPSGGGSADAHGAPGHDRHLVGKSAHAPRPFMDHDSRRRCDSAAVGTASSRPP